MLNREPLNVWVAINSGGEIEGTAATLIELLVLLGSDVVNTCTITYVRKPDDLQRSPVQKSVH